MFFHAYYRNFTEEMDGIFMARSVRDYRLETRTARARLAFRREPYWVLLSEGFHLGYYRGRKAAKWAARHRPAGTAGGYNKTILGEADDTADADGARVLDYRQAQEKAREWLRGVEGGTKVKSTYTVGDALDDYLANFAGKDFNNTKRRVDQLIKPVLGDVRLTRLTKAHVQKFHLDRANTPARLRTAKGELQKYRDLESPEARRKRKSTANRDLTVLKAALNFAYSHERIASDNAWRTVKPFKGVDRARLRYLTDDEARSIVNAVGPEFRPIVQASLLTGARWGELRRITKRDVDLRAGTVWLEETKGAEARPCYLEREGLALFTTQCRLATDNQVLVFPSPDCEAWAESTQIRRMAEASKAAKVEPPVVFHDLRRTFGARLAMAGVPMSVIAQALGHKDERITRKHYAHLAPSYVADQVRAHTAGLGIVVEASSNT